MASARVVIMASGSGTLAQAILDNADARGYNVVALITDQPQAPVIQRALHAGVVVHIVPVTDYQTRAQWDDRMAHVLASTHADIIVSAGFMRVLGAAVVNAFAGRIINSHPSLLPQFPGAHAVADALAAGVGMTGATVHFIDGGVDTGPILAQTSVPVHADDTVETLHERIKTVERSLIVDVLCQQLSAPATETSANAASWAQAEPSSQPTAVEGR